MSSQSWVTCKAFYMMLCIATVRSLLNHVCLQLSLLTWRLRSTYSLACQDCCKAVAAVHLSTLLTLLQAQVT